MQRTTASFAINSITTFKQQMLNWATQFGICCFLDDNGYRTAPYHTYDCLLAAGAEAVFAPADNILQQLDEFCRAHADWLFGHIGYDVKNEIEPLVSSGPDNSGFPPVFLFQPSIVVEVKGDVAVISSLTITPAEAFQQIAACPLFENKISDTSGSLAIKPRTGRDEYIATIKKLQEHILHGDCYEINFCQEFFAEDVVINPAEVFQKLNTLSPTPFACFYKLENKFLLCASPERYVRKSGSKIISQPIKGTAKRNTLDVAADEQLREALKNSEKERAENVMVVDLVRNDLSKICLEGTVEAEELFGVYSFPQVHQMVSTIRGLLPGNAGFADVLRATFPMGSMTGAPKKRVMELIDQYEPVKRGIYSGTVGYITPGGDFDFNVVIRSIIYNAANRYLNYLVGSAITFYSDAVNEYEECILKAEAIEKVLKLV